MLRNYTLPILDFASDTWRQTIVDREPGVYLGHPTTVLLDDQKTIVTVYPKNHGFGQIVLKKSTDGGLTWSERLPVPESWSTSLETPILYKVYDKAGKRRLIMFSSLYPIRMSVSEDDGDTWSELAPIGDYGGIVAMGDIANTAPGEYFALFHDDGRFFRPSHKRRTIVYQSGDGADRRTRVQTQYTPDNGQTWGPAEDRRLQPGDRERRDWKPIYTAYSGETETNFHLYQVWSRDGGLTWSSTPRSICTHSVANLCEPAIVKSPDGHELAVLMRENARKMNSMVIYSTDQGQTWTEPVEMQGALTGDRHCARYLKDGRLFISFRDTCLESPTRGDWCAWLGTYEDIKNGHEGQYRIRIMKNHRGMDCAYPGVEVLPDGTVVTITYGHWTPGEEPYIVAVRIRPKDLPTA
ncbi:MAG TPA: exo-alpha-sialidase [Lentisphaeria bacterium]|nr:exo-alpha-sialidase [Lentisphaeria bacterium]